MADWARLLSECWGSSAAGSNPALPASKNEGLRKADLFYFQPGPPKGDNIRNPPSPPARMKVCEKQTFFYSQPGPPKGDNIRNPPSPPALQRPILRKYRSFKKIFIRSNYLFVLPVFDATEDK